MSTKEDAWNMRPNNPFNWVEITVRAAAEQNPLMTGADMNSTKKPAMKRKIFNQILT